MSRQYYSYYEFKEKIILDTYVKYKDRIEDGKDSDEDSLWECDKYTDDENDDDESA